MSRSDSVRRIGPLERALFLKTLGQLQSLEPSQIAVFAENVREATFAPGEPLFRRGEPACAYHVVTEGRVAVEGGEYPHRAEVGPREPVGFLTMLCGARDGLEATALDETVTLTLEDDALYDILEDNFVIFRNLVGNLARLTLAERRRSPLGTYLAPAEGLLRPGLPERVDFVQRLVLLRRPGSPFAESSLEALARLARSTPEVRFRAGEPLWRFGDPSDFLLLIVAGSVACTRPSGEVILRAGPGYPLGNLERFSGEPRWYSATAETDGVALRGETEVFLDILEDHFDMARAFVAAMARNLVTLRAEMAARGMPPTPLPGQEGSPV